VGIPGRLDRSHQLGPADLEFHDSPVFRRRGIPGPLADQFGRRQPDVGRGSHNLAFPVLPTSGSRTTVFGPNGRGSFTFTGTPPSLLVDGSRRGNGFDLADFLLGTPTRHRALWRLFAYFRAPYVNLYMRMTGACTRGSPWFLVCVGIIRAP